MSKGRKMDSKSRGGAIVYFPTSKIKICFKISLVLDLYFSFTSRDYLYSTFRGTFFVYA